MGRVRDLSPGATPAPLVKRLPLFFGAVRFQESIFALPFAYTGMVLAADGLPSWHRFVWITVAMVAARTLGMSANRLIDRHIDAQNPRTVGRHLPTGALGSSDLLAVSAAAALVFLFAAAQLNALALALAPVAAAYLVVYPYAKRFTWAANLMLGWALAIAPSAAWIGVQGRLSWEPVLLSCAVAAWASSFDILYHAQDRQFYVTHGLHSVAQQFGIEAAFRWARALDAVAVACLVAFGAWMGLPYPYFAGCALAAALLVFKYRLVSPRDRSRLGVTFMRVNAYVSSIMFAGTLIAVLMP